MSRNDLLRAVRTVLVLTGEFETYEVDRIINRMGTPTARYHTVSDYIRAEFGPFPRSSTEAQLIYSIGLMLAA